ncbi:MAG: type II toxin-antitoxin system VapC family toxin [Chloroflexi bacterium]|nr:type II toxin-antitoxin system VapC family toxin [Chloroflexota bacterium]
MNYLLDTNICIYIIKRKPANVLNKFTSFQIDEIGISAIVVAELTFGVQKSAYPERNQLALEHFLQPFEIINFDYKAASSYGIIRQQLQSIGRPIGPLDMLIAAQALSLKVTLVTNNVREFDRVQGLTVENWA